MKKRIFTYFLLALFLIAAWARFQGRHHRYEPHASTPAQTKSHL